MATKLSDGGLEGLDEIFEMLSKLDSINYKKILDEVTRGADIELRNTAPTRARGSQNSKRHIQLFDESEWRYGASVRLGIPREVNWDEYKGLHFNDKGFHPRGSQTYVTIHQGWFDDGTKEVRKRVLQQGSRLLLNEVDRCIKG